MPVGFGRSKTAFIPKINDDSEDEEVEVEKKSVSFNTKVSSSDKRI